MSIDPPTEPKVQSVHHDADGAHIVWGDDITDEEKQIVREAFEDGEHNPARLRELL